MISVIFTLATGYLVAEAPLHIPVLGTKDCVLPWAGFPFGFQPAIAKGCQISFFGQLVGFFVNGLLDVLLFFFPLRLLHDRFLHRKPRS